MIKRTIEEKLRQMTTKFPVVTLTGTRQCGKSTLLRQRFSDFKYISLEDLDNRQFAVEDPRGFLMNFETPLIVDESQYAPNLISFQTISRHILNAMSDCCVTLAICRSSCVF